MDRLEQEAQIFTQYLIKRDATPQAIKLYKAAMKTSQPDVADGKLLNFMVAHPRLIGLIDAGLVFHNASSEARRRLYVMLAINEASPEHCDLFLAKKRNPFYVLVVAYVGFRAVVLAMFGVCLVKVIA